MICETAENFRQAKLERAYKEPPRGAAAVMLDGGRLQTRAEDGGRGVREASWRESKVACCLTLQTKAQDLDPEPEPPSKFLEPTEAARLASEVKRRSRPAVGRSEEHREEPKSSPRPLSVAPKCRERLRAVNRPAPRRDVRLTGSTSPTGKEI